MTTQVMEVPEDRPRGIRVAALPPQRRGLCWVSRGELGVWPKGERWLSWHCRGAGTGWQLVCREDAAGGLALLRLGGRQAHLSFSLRPWLPAHHPACVYLFSLSHPWVEASEHQESPAFTRRRMV